MNVIWGLERIDSLPNSATTLGSFDGVHRGHVAIIDELLERKRALDLDRAVVLTFHPHPQQVLLHRARTNGEAPSKPPVKLLTTLDERLPLLAAAGVDECIVIEFTESFSRLTYREFFEEIIVKRLNTNAMVVGFNHAFGKDREGDIEHLRSIAAPHDIPIDSVAPCLDGDANISSTRIRKALAAGDVVTASRSLGREYAFTGVVVGGDHLGRTLGYPTANLDVNRDKLLPADGVYSCTIDLYGAAYRGALSIGTRPTIGDGLKRAVEVFLLDFSGSLYGERLTVRCGQFLREQEAFDNLSLLTQAIERDVIRIREGANHSFVF